MPCRYCIGLVSSCLAVNCLLASLTNITSRPALLLTVCLHLWPFLTMLLLCVCRSHHLLLLDLWSVSCFFFKYIHLYFYFFPILFFFSLLELTSVYNLARAIDSYGWALSYFWCRPLLTTAFKSETGFLLQPTYTAELGR